MPVDRSQVCCFIGHEVIPPGEEAKIRARVRNQVMPLVYGDVLYFGVGGGRGFDRIATEFALHLRDKVKNRIRIISVLPFPGYMDSWEKEDRDRQEEIIRQCDKVVYVAQEEHDGIYLERDRKLVDGSGYCVCYCHRATGRTAASVQYAIKQGIQVINASSWNLRWLENSRRL